MFHIDITSPNKELWKFLKRFILRYNVVIVSSEKYKREDLPVEQKVMPPAIDPFSPKNMEISDRTISKYLRKFGIPIDKPLITQISRFDKWKDPMGIIDAFKLVRKMADCRLVLCGNMATDDPEGWMTCERVRRKAKRLIEKGDVLMITNANNILVNALQRSSAVVVQKSIREGFGLTVTEALWKERPVVASNVGGIPLQIKDGENGFLIDSHDTEGFADRIIKLLNDPTLAQKIGVKGKESVMKKFLITRLLLDYLNLLNEIGQ
ncbi:MAG: glycosyltransferase [Candidatus Aenigmarchaeota archaeon]|nr:glycosyltransferase [Candidatus Aenigmarchaeota archaeon]